MWRVLVVEDSADDVVLLARELKKQSKPATFERVETAPDMRRALTEQRFDIIVSDYSMPEFSALEALAVARELAPDLPFIIVSGTIGEETAVAALRAGAHDFMIKGNLSRLVPAMEREIREAAERLARRRAEEAVQASELRFQALIENALDIIAVIDADGNVRLASPSLQRLLGYDPQRTLGRSLFEPVHADDQQRLRRMLDTVMQRPGTVSSTQLRYRHRKTGAWLTLELHCKNVLDQPEVGGIVVNARDVTTRVEAEGALRRALAELRATQRQVVQQERLRALGEMASGVAHDFNNSLSAIIGFTENILMYPDDLADQARTLETIRTINTVAQDAASVVSRLGLFYRSRDDSEAFAPLDLKTLIEQSVAITSPRWNHQARAVGAAIRVETEFETLPPVAGLEGELRQVLTNLIFNATDAMPEGGVLTIRTLARPPHAVIEVSDSGIGMSDEVLSRCLEPFFTTKGSCGTGLGLAMVYGVISRHQGHIEVQSRVGEGTTFRLYLPLSESSAGAGAASTRSDDSRPLHVLVVEEEPLIRQVLGDYLNSDGHCIEFADDGAQTIEKLEQGDIDIVLTSHTLPGVGGEQLAARIKQERPHLPVVLVTGFAHEAAGNDSSVDALLHKPFTLASLRQALISAIDRHATI
jgi:PAS domain S-box-containing protein